MSSDLLPDDAAEELVRATRTTVGDSLRSITYFTEDDVEGLYRRDDLDEDANITGFAEIERMGFRSQTGYSRSALGDYRFTIRVFDSGYVTRVIEGDHGIFIATGEMTTDRFSDAASAVRTELQKIDPAEDKA